jgi:hypothetical protein
MWNPFRRRPSGLPRYASLDDRPDWPAPADLRQAEEQAWQAHHQDTMEALLDASRRPAAQAPQFVTLMSPGGDGLLTLPIGGDDAGRCALVFTTGWRAGDYAAVVCGRPEAAGYLASGPAELARMAADVEASGVVALALDRCPRCSAFAAVGVADLRTADAVVRWWALCKATELLRVEAWLHYVRGLARAGDLSAAREVALQMTAHVVGDDPRVHFLLGQIAIALQDRRTVEDARAVLRYQQHDRWAAGLHALAAAGAPTPGFALEP